MGRKKTTKQTVEEFLASGGAIEVVEPGATGVHYPIRRSRKAQVNFLKRRDWDRAKKGENNH